MTLYDLPGPMLRLTGAKFSWSGTYDVAALMARRGDLKLTDIRSS